jgi:general secretion pathway protein M
MTLEHLISRYLTRSPLVATSCYVALVLILVFTTWVSIVGIVERQAAVAAAGVVLEQLGGRRTAPTGADPTTGPVPTGSAFLEGQTVTIAGAALMQRVVGAVRKVGGNVLSSQVAIEGSQAKTGLVSVVLSCEVGQPELQQLLYDLEAGMPFLFVDQMVAQSPQGFTGLDGGKMRILLGVSGQWDGAQ